MSCQNRIFNTQPSANGSLFISLEYAFLNIRLAGNYERLAIFAREHGVRRIRALERFCFGVQFKCLPQREDGFVDVDLIGLQMLGSSSVRSFHVFVTFEVLQRIKHLAAFDLLAQA